ncbi:hypothetical protein [Methylogaea oryzae]|uniref:hypothetical protein n=1 Tax=Methylogaea oryzae TaxID=1295382 RepID=UPI0012E0FDCA|nr:hypothetical protein [Methylogaea oryzae]
MDTINVIVTALGWLAAGFWLWFGLRTARFLRGAVLTRRVSASPTPAAWPKVSVIVPARNEAAAIGLACNPCWPWIIRPWKWSP